MSLYSWRGQVKHAPLLTLESSTRVNIVADVNYDRAFKDYSYDINHVRVFKVDDLGNETGRFMVIPSDFLEEVLDVKPDKLSEFMEDEYNRGNLNMFDDPEDSPLLTFRKGNVMTELRGN